jgi:hypothetical protein
MSATFCQTCRTHGGMHTCWHCNKKFSVLEELVEHQKHKQHYGNHFVLMVPDVAGRGRRRAAVRSAAAEDEKEDEEEGALVDPAEQLQEEEEMADDDDVANLARDLDADQPGDQDHEVVVDVDDDAPGNGGAAAAVAPSAAPPLLQQLAAERKRKRNDAKGDNGPKWVQEWRKQAQAEFITLEAPYVAYTCVCSPSTERVVGGSKSNIEKHLKSDVCKAARGTPAQRVADMFVPTLTQRNLNRMVLDFVVSGAALSVVENEDFKRLCEYGRGREQLRVMSRKTLTGQLEDEYKREREAVKSVIHKAVSKVTVGFDLWTNSKHVSFMGITGHFFDSERELQCKVLDLVHMDKKDVGSTAPRIAAAVETSLASYDIKKTDYNCGVTDGAANVIAASKLLGESRKCFQHRLQLFLKYVAASIAAVADAVAVCNYLAKLSKLSTVFALAVDGVIDAGVVTRWNSILRAAQKVCEKKDKIRAYVEHADSKVSAKLKGHMDHLNTEGFLVLKDFYTFISPLMRLCTDLEGELHVTASLVVPALLAARDTMFKELRSRNHLASWVPTVEKAYSVYLKVFESDEVFTCASLLDGRVTYKALDAWPDALQAAATALKRRVTDEYDKREADRSAAQRVLATSAAAVGDGTDVRRLSAVFGIALDPQQAATTLPSRNYGTPEEEIKALLLRARAADEPDSFKALAWLNGLPLCYAVAANVLSVPCGEAPAERVFSIAGRVFRGRERLTPQRLAQLVYLRKNRA